MDYFKKLVARLKEHTPPILPVRIYKRDLKKGSHFLAYTELKYKNNKANHFIIVLDSKLFKDENVLKHFLIHEWAHVISWREGHIACDHNPEWGLAVSTIYQEVIDF
jgi:predicted SprT family Zn-dependent metalloprotease